MKNRYIEQVLRLLPASRREKREIARDLEEAFSSARENGETEAKLIERLGSPEEFAERVAGPDAAARRKRRAQLQFAGLLAAALACFVIFWLALALRPPETVIGGADSMTRIRVEGAFDPIWIFAALGGAALLFAVVRAVLFWRRRR